MFATIFSLFPSILTAIIAVEGAVKATGPQKKALVLTSVVAVAQIGEALPEPHVKAISALIDNIVTNLNNTGVFTTSTK